LVPIAIEFGEEDLPFIFDEEEWQWIMSEASGSDLDDVEVSDMKVFQVIQISGLNNATFLSKHEEALRTAYSSIFSDVDKFTIAFGNETMPSVSRRQLEEGHSLNITITIQIVPESTNIVISGITNTTFRDKITQSLVDVGENEAVFKDTEVTGIQMTFSVQAEATQIVDDTIINNADFISAFSDAAIAKNALSASAAIIADVSQVTIITIAPTSTPTQAGTLNPTILPTNDPTIAYSKHPTILPTPLTSMPTHYPSNEWTHSPTSEPTTFSVSSSLDSRPEPTAHILPIICALQLWVCFLSMS
jgi:hypothetical protein